MPSEPRKSSVIVPARGTGASFEVFWSRRQFHMRFLGGFYAFFGGAVEPGDGRVPLSRAPGPGMPDEEFYGCAARELFEESGILVLEDRLLFAGRGAEIDGLGSLDEFRRAVLDEDVDFARSLERADLRVPTDRLRPIGRWITPEFSDIRFDSEFFLLHLRDAEADRLGSDGLEGELLEEELIDGCWIRPSEALDRWRSAEVFVSQPIRFTLEALINARPETDDLYVDESDVERKTAHAKTAGGIYVIPMKTPTLPPATHTNCVIVGEQDFVVIDPGSPNAADRELLWETIDEMLAEGRTFRSILLTHHHQDHILAAGPTAQKFDVGIRAHEKTIEHLLDELEFEGEVEDGERIDLGDDSLTAIYTPGHASGHLCFLHERTNLILGGDLVASYGTILVNPPDGHMGRYLESLRTVRDLESSGIVPAHGWVITNPRERLDFYIRHRLEREEKVRAALRAAGKPSTAGDLVPHAYDDVPPKVWPLAARSVLAHLEHLVELGEAVREDDRFSFV